MRVTLSWLAEFVDLPTDDPEAIATAFENLGHEVEGWERLEAGFNDVVVGRVVEVAPHPDADKIRLCRVDVGDEVLEIVCGAWNFDAGAHVPVALPGAILPGGLEITRRRIRGVVSNGMICSEAELDLGDEAAGIMVLDRDYPEAAERIGAPFVDLLPLPDVVFDVSITPNRPDCMSVVGLARELAARYGVALRVPTVEVEETGEPSEVTVDVVDPVACPRFVAREVRHLTVGPSPHPVRLRLRACGVRPISNVVDASNYVMLELGHPTHAFDGDRLGDVIVVRHARDGEGIVTLDGQERVLTSDDIVVADGEHPVAVAGVMGGADTEVHDGTRRVVIEAAYWHPPSILLTSKRLGLRTEASARFERGMDPEACPRAADRVAELLVAFAGGRPAPPLVDVYPDPFEPRTVELPPGEVKRVLGVELAPATVTGLLERLGFAVEGTSPLVVTVPTRRPDVSRPVDLVEEVARLHGFENIPDRVRTGPGGGLPGRLTRLRRLRGVLQGAGYHEIASFSFMAPTDLDALALPLDDPARAAVRVVNPLRDEESHLRTTLLPGLLRAAAVNRQRLAGPARLYEVGTVFLAGAGELPEQPERLGFVAAGTLPPHWASEAREPDVFDATGLWELIADDLRLPEASVEAHRHPAFHPGRCGRVLVGGGPVGVVGEIHPAVARRFDLTGRIVAGELDLAPLLADRGRWTFHPPSPFPPAIFDLAFAVDATLPGAKLLDAVDTAAGELLERRDLFDVYRDLGEGRVSLAVRITLRAPDRTLRDEEVADVRRAIVAAVEAATGGRLRGEA